MTLVVSRHQVETFRSLVARHLGLFFDESKLSLLTEALRRRIVTHGGAGDSYLQHLAAPHEAREELRSLAEMLTVTETYFFRNADQIRAFVERALPQHLDTRTGAQKLRVLSAGCASGEEPYSLAIAIRERLPDVADRVAITGVDVNPSMLEKARRGCYSNWSLREVRAESRNRWFNAEGGCFALDPSIRRMVTFEERNLVYEDLTLWQPETWNVVFCRNVLMYFTPALMQKVVARIASALAPCGYLFVGHAETLRGLSNDFHLCHTHDTFYYERKELLSEGAPVGIARPELNWTIESPSNDTSWIDTVRQASERIHVLAQSSEQLGSKPAKRQALTDPLAADLRRTIDLLRHERFGEAIDHLGALPVEQARDPTALLLRAVSLVHSGALDEAEKVCRELLVHDEMNAGAHYMLALCREGRGDAQGAAEEDQVAASLDPGFSMARLHLGLLARRRGERSSARRELTQALASLQQEDDLRLLLFGGGFDREALMALCQSELAACGEAL